MAILQSCCCFRTVRKGSFASAIFTLISDSVSVMFMSIFVHEERNYISGNTTQARTTSFVQPETISPTSMTFSVVVLSGACCGLVSSLLLIYGLIRDNRIFLIPWIVVVLIKTIIDISHTCYLIVLATYQAKLNPVPIILFTLDFFLYVLTLYAFLCVVSQYQEYKAGRGRAEDDPSRYPANYVPQPTATSCLSTRKPATYHETTATEPRSTLVTNDYTMSPVHQQGRKSTTKHVQFGSSEEQAHLNGNPTSLW